MLDPAQMRRTGEEDEDGVMMVPVSLDDGISTHHHTGKNISNSPVASVPKRQLPVFFSLRLQAHQTLDEDAAASTVSVNVMFGWRLFCFLGTLVVNVSFFASDFSSRHFIFLSNLSFMLQTIYFALASVCSYRFIRRLVAVAHEPVPVVEGSDPATDATPRTGLVTQWTWLLFEILVPLTLFISVVFWVLLYDGHGIGFFNFQIHAVNSLIMVAELALCRFRFVGCHYFFFLFFMLTYLGVVWGYYFLYDSWLYQFLEISAPSAILVYLGLSAATFVIFFLSHVLAWIRERFVRLREKKLEFEQ
eukprot:gnl/Hemi2/17163_TR5711_c0_g1_i1.p1 gnl/Hemi2/17163_TR5711_c0_g1~~gnl/Hemi2/17163_TR5711_c0_g1_i1.p1  ORF type:complete len:316 (+),score=59.54 gnl/Hemi2/17163_TR5711_c0_g1_i1:39-950(+)